MGLELGFLIFGRGYFFIKRLVNDNNFKCCFLVELYIFNFLEFFIDL